MTLLLVRLILLQKYILRFCGLVIGATKHFRPCLEIPQDFGVRILAPNVGRAGGFGCSFFFFLLYSTHVLKCPIFFLVERDKFENFRTFLCFFLLGSKKFAFADQVLTKSTHWVLGIYKYNEEQILLKIEDRSVTCWITKRQNAGLIVLGKCHRFHGFFTKSNTILEIFPSKYK